MRVYLERGIFRYDVSQLCAPAAVLLFEIATHVIHRLALFFELQYQLLPCARDLIGAPRRDGSLPQRDVPLGCRHREFGTGGRSGLGAAAVRCHQCSVPAPGRNSRTLGTASTAHHSHSQTPDTRPNARVRVRPALKSRLRLLPSHQRCKRP